MSVYLTYTQFGDIFAPRHAPGCDVVIGYPLRGAQAYGEVVRFTSWNGPLHSICTEQPCKRELSSDEDGSHHVRTDGTNIACQDCDLIVQPTPTYRFGFYPLVTARGYMRCDIADYDRFWHGPFGADTLESAHTWAKKHLARWVSSFGSAPYYAVEYHAPDWNSLVEVFGHDQWLPPAMADDPGPVIGYSGPFDHLHDAQVAVKERIEKERRWRSRTKPSIWVETPALAGPKNEATPSV